MSEEWRDVKGYEGAYQVSNLGRVRSLDRVIIKPNRWGGNTKTTKRGIVLKLRKCTNDYITVNLRPGTKSHLVHRLVAAAFIDGDTSLNVNHKNGIRDDNRVGNLEWLSYSDNHKHSYRCLSRKKHALTTCISIEKGSCKKTFESMLSASRYLFVKPGSVSSALHKNHLCKGWRICRV